MRNHAKPGRRGRVLEDNGAMDYPRQFKGNAMVALFRHRRMFVDFVDAFVDLRGARAALRLDRAETLPRSFVTERLRAGERDVVWKVPDEGGKEFAVFLIEHQSAVDYSMPMRMQLYKHALWQDHRAAVPARIRQAEGFRWPLVLPVVLYTGAEPWSGPMRLADIVAHGIDFEDLYARLEFLLVDVARLSDAQLVSPGNFARAIIPLIRALMCKDAGTEFFTALAALAPYWNDEELDLICRVVYHYILAHGPSAAIRRRLRELFASEEVMENPRTLAKSIFDAWLEEGRAEGRTEGRAEGRTEGRAEKEAAILCKDLAAITQLFARKSLAWGVYGPDVEALDTHDALMDLMLDLATAADPAAFLRERFGH